MAIYSQKKLPKTTWRHWGFIIVVWLLVLLSSLSVVYSAYDTRIKFNKLEDLRRERNQLQVEWGQYLLEESAWASYNRIEKVALEKLLMQAPSVDKVVMVTVDD